MPRNKYAISDELWEKIQEFIPARENTHPRGGGRKPRDDREVFDAILFVLRFGCRWNALNATGLCPSSTVHDRFRKWASAGFFHKLLEEGLLDRDAATRDIDWSWLTTEEEMPRPGLSRKKSPLKTSGTWTGKNRPNLASRRYIKGI